MRTRVERIFVLNQDTYSYVGTSVLVASKKRTTELGMYVQGEEVEIRFTPKVSRPIWIRVS